MYHITDLNEFNNNSAGFREILKIVLCYILFWLAIVFISNGKDLSQIITVIIRVELPRGNLIYLSRV